MGAPNLNLTPMANSSSFSSVVSGLVRAQMGSSIPQATLDEELDKRVAELILKEARQKEAQFGKTGSYSPKSSGNAARTNKRFLTSIIKSTDEHNKTILKAQSEAALEVKQQREREEREERMRRAQEAVAARTGCSSSSWRSKNEKPHRTRSVSEERHERHRSSTHERKRERSPYPDVDSDHQDRRHKRHRRDNAHDERRSASPTRRRDRSKDKTVRDEDGRRSSQKSSRRRREEGDETRKEGRRHSSRSRSPRRREHEGSKGKSRHRDSPHVEGSHDHKDSKHRRLSLPSSREGSNRPAASQLPSSKVRTPAREDNNSGPEEVIGPLLDPSEAAPKEISSKMDKYFAEGYDPRLDVAPALSMKDGLIPPGAFDNWDMMLQIVKARREEKEERKRLEKVHRSSSSSSRRKDAPSATLLRENAEDLLSIQYTKRGGVREWDEGKKDT